MASVIASVSGLIMGIKMPFGESIETVYVVIIFAMVSYASVQGILNIRNRRVLFHQAWMIRLFCWSMSIATMRVVLGVFYNIQPWSDREWFAHSLIIGLIINAFAAELWIKRFVIRSTKKEGEL